MTTLGRGGSDLSATVLGAALDLKEVQVWKDVDGGCAACLQLENDACVLDERMGYMGE